MSSSEWVTKSIKKVAYINKNSIQKNYPNQFISYIDTASVTNNIFDAPQLVNFSEAPSRAKRIVSRGDTIISSVRPNLRHFGFVEDVAPNTIVSTGFVVLTPFGISPKYLYYLLTQDSVTDFLAAIAETSTTTFPAFRPEVLADYEITFPKTFEEQERLANILYCLEKKIELNRQMNATLEAMAQAIFKEWFVDFNYPGATGDLVDSPLGPIPRGWEVGKLIDIAVITMGQSPEGSSYNQDAKGMIFFQGKAEFGFRFPTINKFTTEPKRLAKRFDTLVSVRAPVGSINMADNNCCIGRGLASVRSNKKGWSFIYYLLLSLQDYFLTYEGTGTVFGSINKDQLEGIQVVIPSDTIMKLFENAANPIDFQILENYLESATLMDIRDQVLPVLMNGEIAL
jgi:type I restriction enzyme S subunit